MLKIVQFNAHSLPAHINQVRLWSSANFAHVISISETWLHAHIQDALVELKDYFLIRKDRDGREGGGIAVYIHNSLKAKIIYASPTEFTGSPEFLILEIRNDSSESLLLTSMYRRPNSELLNNFAAILERFSHAYKNIVITGDLNCNMLTNDSEARHLKRFIYSSAYHLVEFGPTFHLHSYDSWLDVMIVDDPTKIVAFSKTEVPFINGHDLLELTYCFNTPKVTARMVTRRSLTHFHDYQYVDLVRELLETTEPRDPTNMAAGDIERKVANLTNSLISALDITAPLRTFKVTRPPEPWLTPDLKSRMAQRSSLYKKARRTNSLLGYALYRHHRNALTADIKRAKNEYHMQKLESISDPRVMWRELMCLGLVKSNLNSPLHFFSAEELNSHYVAVSNSDEELSLDVLYQSLDNVQTWEITFDFSFDFSLISRRDIEEICNQYSTYSLMTGPDGLTIFGVRKALTAIIDKLVEIFNLSIELGHYPSIYKKAFIVPHSKINIPKSPSDTRPVANLPEPSKIFERAIHKQITHYVEQNNIFDEKQSAYRSGFSTQTALVKIFDDVRKNTDAGRLTILVLFDYSKAFDTVSHLLLLIKLKKLGFTNKALKFVHSYLTGRSQAVVDSDRNCSSWLNTTMGVPQGSVLGPLLFSLFINNIGEGLRYSEHMVFADDTQIYLSCEPHKLNEALAKISYDVNAIYEFSLANKLNLNIKKSNVMILGSSPRVRHLETCQLPFVTLNGIRLPYVTETRNLGVLIMSNLGWNSHVAAISRKVYATLYKLKFHRTALSTAVRIKLITTLVFPHIDYCCLVYHQLTDELNSKLQKIINSCIRFIFDLRLDEHITPYRRNLGWLSVKGRREYFQAILVHKILHGNVPHYIRQLLVNTNDLATRRTTRLPARTFNIPRFNTEIYRNSFSISAAYLWNSLPTHVTSATSIGIFKQSMFKHLFDNEA